MGRTHDWQVVLVVEWVFSRGHQSGLPLFSTWPLHFVWLDSSETWFCEGESKTTLINRTCSSVQALTMLPFCIAPANVPLAQASHMTKPRLNLGRNDSPQEHEYWEAWLTGSQVPAGTLKFYDSVLVFLFV